MEFHYASNETCHTATGVVVVIDVIRAFSNAAYAFRVGADSITLVSGVEEALELKNQIPGSLAMGEVGGLPPAGFDFGNSPTEILRQDLRGKLLIQRTGAGTQGAVNCVNADKLFACSFPVAEATVQVVLRLKPEIITFVITGRDFNGEDRACAEYLEARLRGELPDPDPYLERARNANEIRLMPPEIFPYIASDIDFCTRLDSCPFAMPISRENGRLVMRPLQPDHEI
jgi:2-phosphosulfolactate phosphatase